MAGDKRSRDRRGQRHPPLRKGNYDHERRRAGNPGGLYKNRKMKQESHETVVVYERSRMTVRAPPVTKEITCAQSVFTSPSSEGLVGVTVPMASPSPVLGPSFCGRLLTVPTRQVTVCSHERTNILSLHGNQPESSPYDFTRRLYFKDLKIQLCIDMCTGGRQLLPHLLFVTYSKRRHAAPLNLGYLHTNGKHILCANFDLLGQKVRSPGQVKVRCAPRDRLQTSRSCCGHIL